MTSAPSIAERILTLLDHGAYESTYKHAVLTAMLDLCLAGTDAEGHPPDSITTRQLAEQVIALYWPQTRQWQDGILRQSSQGPRDRGGAKIVRRVWEVRTALGRAVPGAPRLDLARYHIARDFERLVRDVERVLILMPLPKLQRVGGEDTGWLYVIGWDDGAAQPKPAELTAYFDGRPSAFDNQIRLKPGVAEAFVRLHGILRPFVEQHWARKVARLNDIEEQRLPAFLFGVERRSLEPVRAPLVDLQRGRCFYCDRGMRGTAHVDHFIPWSRHPDNGLHNLVAAHHDCNGAKRDHLAATGHVQRWRRRATERADALDHIAARVGWAPGATRIVGVARALYLGLPDDARLWTAANRFERPDIPGLRAALAGCG